MYYVFDCNGTKMPFEMVYNQIFVDFQEAFDRLDGLNLRDEIPIRDLTEIS